VYKPDKVKEAEVVFGSNDSEHPAVNYLHNKAQDYYVGGTLQAMNRLNHYDYIENRCE
jgi:sulfate adenylyltransferase